MNPYLVAVVAGLLWLTALLLAIPALVFFIELAVATLARSKPAASRRPPLLQAGCRFAVLIPAHDEAGGITASIAAVRSQCRVVDRVLVVADNCSDATAKVARDAGAEVVERRDANQRGKGFALDFGVRWLERDPPDAVVIVDADCVADPLALQWLVTRCLASGRPVQARYLMHAPRDSGLGMRIAELAWAVKNHLRPRGCALLGAPCQLTGSGMAMPWRVIQQASLATGHLVEDMQLGTDLASSGLAPLFCEEATVHSNFPLDKVGIDSQRTRWEHGHLGMLISVGPRLLLRGLTTGNIGLMAMALDLMVPPLSSLVLLLVAYSVTSTAWYAVTGLLAPLVITGTSLTLVAVGVAAAWYRVGRRIVRLKELGGLPLYVIAKIPVYMRAITQRQVEWVRTKRDDRND